MVGVAECRAAIARASERITEVDEERRRRHIRERSISITVTDLDTVFDMRLTLEGLADVTVRDPGAPARRAQIGVTVSSDDLVDLADDRLDVAKALFAGRVRIDASIPDLMRLRKLL
ncbi:SCP2 sterol-binding domain-containing protein [Halostreptopolyspora alba]|uniref:SCP-2 sterol transfer family protein n=1 Tax=Halostreptopolyspora alba TaxID=2487137 RepID=A0A3N0EBI3_9ACTN|nr:SCP-2 sterol transfer family protein [Nocardiopsaceae bacterium YIM 96095]